MIPTPAAVFLCPSCASRGSQKPTWKNPGNGRWQCSGCGGQTQGVSYLRMDLVRGLLQSVSTATAEHVATGAKAGPLEIGAIQATLALAQDALKSSDRWFERAKTLEAERDAARKRVTELAEQMIVTTDVLAERQQGYEGACVTIAKMHAAALGKVQGPIRGVVEDIADLRAERDAARNERDAAVAHATASAIEATALRAERERFWLGNQIYPKRSPVIYEDPRPK